MISVAQSCFLLTANLVHLVCYKVCAMSGIARLGHTGACALATRGRAPVTRGHAAPPVQVRNRIIGTDSIAQIGH